MALSYGAYKAAVAAARPFDRSNRRFAVGGTTAAGFENVREAFVNNFRLGLEKASQFVVFWRGELVVNLYGSQSGRRSTSGQRQIQEYGSDSLQICMSCSKVLTSICMAVAVDRGWLHYNDKVARHWPDFAQYGKQDITVADILRHEGGLVTFGAPLTRSEITNHSILEKKIEKAVPNWDYSLKTRRAYHAESRGFILNCLFRRVDPKQR
jgi:CubicO group peptidase (beta-lactamase class C family)